jgi:beta-N-acetylglucosaminidase
VIRRKLTFRFKKVILILVALLLLQDTVVNFTLRTAQAKTYTTPRLSLSQVKITNNLGKWDTIYVTRLKKGDVIRLYNSRGFRLATQTSKGYSTTLYIKQLSVNSGKIALTLTRFRQKTSSKTYISYYSENSAAIKSNNIRVYNNQGSSDVIFVNQLSKGDVVRAYNAKGQLLKTQISKGSTTSLSIKQLGLYSGVISLTLTHPYRRTSGKTYISYSAELSASLSPGQISVTNNHGVPDKITVSSVRKGDVIRVYNQSGQQLAAVTAQSELAALSVSQLGMLAGRIYVTVTHSNLRQSNKTAVNYKAEPIVLQYHTTQYLAKFSEILNKQINTSPQTDKNYAKYIYKDSLKVSGSTAIIKPTSDPYDKDVWNVRGLPNTTSWVITRVQKGKKVSVIKPVQNSPWYQIDFSTSWVNASPADIQYYLNPANFKVGTTGYYQFLQLSIPSVASADEINNKILYNRGILKGKASTFIQAARQQHINEIYLIAHALLETGNGASQLANGILVTSVDGKKVTPRKVYNMFGVGAVDSDPIKQGSEYAYKNGWFTPESAIIGGAQFIGSKYINNASYHQDTLYKMRWNPADPATHQYASDIGWAAKQTSLIKGLYNMLSSYYLTFDVPKYGN